MAVEAGWEWAETDTYRAAWDAAGDRISVRDRAAGTVQVRLDLYCGGRYEIYLEREHGCPTRYPVRFNDGRRAVMHALDLLQGAYDELLQAFTTEDDRLAGR